MVTLSQLQERLSTSLKDDRSFNNRDRGAFWLMDWTYKSPAARLKELMHKTESGSIGFAGTPEQFQGIVHDVLILATSCHIDLERSLWEKYPGKCPYCSYKPCRCGQEKAAPHRRRRTLRPGRMSLFMFQDMFRAIYPVGRHSLSRILEKCTEEWEEAREALFTYLDQGDPAKRLEFNEEFSDLLAWLLQAANTIGVPLEGLERLLLEPEEVV